MSFSFIISSKDSFGNTKNNCSKLEFGLLFCKSIVYLLLVLHKYVYKSLTNGTP